VYVRTLLDAMLRTYISQYSYVVAVLTAMVVHDHSSRTAVVLAALARSASAVSVAMSAGPAQPHCTWLSTSTDLDMPVLQPLAAKKQCWPSCMAASCHTARPASDTIASTTQTMRKRLGNCPGVSAWFEW